MRKHVRRSTKGGGGTASELDALSASGGRGVVDSRRGSVVQARLQAIADQRPAALRIDALQSGRRRPGAAAPVAQLRAVGRLTPSAVVQRVALLRDVLKEGTLEAAIKVEMEAAGVSQRFRSTLLMEARDRAAQAAKEQPDISIPLFYFQVVDAYQQKYGLREADEEAAAPVEQEAEADPFAARGRAQGGAKYEDMEADTHREVGAMALRGRQAQDLASKVTATRRQQAGSSLSEMAQTGALMGLDVLAPGAGTGIGAALTANALREKHKVGKLKKEAAKTVVWEGAAQLFQFISFGRAAGRLAKAVFQPAKSRTAEKVEKAKELVTQIDESVPKARALLATMEKEGASEQSRARLEKAIRRMIEARAQALEWTRKKEEHASMPLSQAPASDG
jgi:hypothetical protein